MRIFSLVYWQKTCCPLGSKVREHESISFLSLVFPWLLNLIYQSLSRRCFGFLSFATNPVSVQVYFYYSSHLLSYYLHVCWQLRICLLLSLPSTDALLGRIVMAPSATLSWPITGEILDPQLSEPTHRKWPVWLFLLAASRTRLF